MASSLIGGLVTQGWPKDRIWVSDPDPRQLELLRQCHFGILTTDDNHEGARQADVIVFAVKPQILKAVVTDLADTITDSKPLIISIAAGVQSTDIMHWLREEFPIVRCIPNTPALVGSSATGLFSNPLVTDTQRNIAENILRAVGLTLWFDNESSLDAVTALSGSGPAYFLLVMEALEAAGIRLGLTAENARLLTLQTAFGTAKLALESKENVSTLRARVTSPGGTTEKAIEQLEKGKLRDLFECALTAAAARSKELADEFEEKS